jgi:hypothetical protein
MRLVESLCRALWSKLTAEARYSEGCRFPLVSDLYCCDASFDQQMQQVQHSAKTQVVIRQLFTPAIPQHLPRPTVPITHRLKAFVAGTAAACLPLVGPHAFTCTLRIAERGPFCAIGVPAPIVGSAV